MRLDMKQPGVSLAPSKQVEKIFACIAIILPPIFTICFVYKFGLTIPYWDQWELVPLLEKMHNHTLGLADLWSQHNEHRVIFPQILMVLLAYFSNWNIFLELCTSLILAILSLLFLFSILGNTSETKTPWLKIIISLLVFSMVQYENWIWGWQLQIFMSVLGTIIAMWAANKWQGKSLGMAIAILAAILASYSFGSGLATWPAIFVLLLIQKKWKLKHIIILITACIATVLLYYYNYTKSPSNTPISFFMEHPLSYIRYILTYLGSPLGQTGFTSLAMALILLILTSYAIFNIWRYDKQKLYDLAPWLGLAIYALLAACMTGLGRAGSGWHQALSSRYTTISVLFTISAVILVYHSMIISFSIKKNIKNILFTFIVICIFLVSYIDSYRRGIKDMKTKSNNVNASAFCLTHPEIADEYSLKRLYPDPNTARSRIKTLSELGVKFKSSRK